LLLLLEQQEMEVWICTCQPWLRECGPRKTLLLLMHG
jgi:hypothetical protein